MIQDLEGKRLYNEYVRTEAAPQDYVFSFSGSNIMIKGELGTEMTLPKAKSFDSETLQYMFRIGEEKYFLHMNFDENKELMEGFRWENPRLLRHKKAKEICFAASTAQHLYIWYRDNQYCGRCQEKLIHDKDERALVCPECGNRVYPKIAPAVIVALVNGDRILLTKYAGRTFKRYALIAGFVETGETAEDTVRREVMEEVGLKVNSVRYYKSQPWGVESDLLLGYVADLEGSDNVTLDETELSTAEWFDRADMPVTENDEISLTSEMMYAFYRGLL